MILQESSVPVPIDKILPHIRLAPHMETWSDGPTYRDDRWFWTILCMEKTMVENQEKHGICFQNIKVSKENKAKDKWWSTILIRSFLCIKKIMWHTDLSLAFLQSPRRPLDVQSPTDRCLNHPHLEKSRCEPISPLDNEKRSTTFGNIAPYQQEKRQGNRYIDKNTMKKYHPKPISDF